MKNLQKEFTAWLDTALNTAPLDQIVAVNFNLYEADEDYVFHVQVVGTASFDEENEDWACGREHLFPVREGLGRLSQ